MCKSFRGKFFAGRDMQATYSTNNKVSGDRRNMNNDIYKWKSFMSSLGRITEKQRSKIRWMSWWTTEGMIARFAPNYFTLRIWNGQRRVRLTAKYTRGTSCFYANCNRDWELGAGTAWAVECWLGKGEEGKGGKCSLNNQTSWGEVKSEKKSFEHQFDFISDAKTYRKVTDRVRRRLRTSEVE